MSMKYLIILSDEFYLVWTNLIESKFFDWPTRLIRNGLNSISFFQSILFDSPFTDNDYNKCDWLYLIEKSWFSVYLLNSHVFSILFPFRRVSGSQSMEYYCSLHKFRFYAFCSCKIPISDSIAHTPRIKHTHTHTEIIQIHSNEKQTVSTRQPISNIRTVRHIKSWPNTRKNEIHSSLRIVE